MAIRIGWIKNNEAPDGEQSRADMQQTLSQSSIMKIDSILSDNARGYLSETQRAVRLTSNLIDSGAQLPASLDFTFILMTDYGLWYLQCICPTLDITEVENLSLPSQWIFACLVRTVRPCYESVSRQLQGFPVNKFQRYTSTQHLAGEINSSQGDFRHRLLLSLIIGGSMPMLEPLLFHGLSMGDLSTYYLEIALRRGRTNIAQLLWTYGASLSLATSNQLLEHIKPDLKTLLRDPNKSETFCRLLTQILDSFGPLQEIDAEHALFDSLVPIFQEALLLSTEEQTSSTLNSAVIQLLLKHSAFSSLETSARVLKHIVPDKKTLLLDESKSEIFCHFLAQVLESCGPLQRLDDEHAIFESLVLIFQAALLLPNEEQTSSTSKIDDCICNKVLRLLVEGGLFRDSKLPARYWSFHDLLRDSYMKDSPLTLAIYVRNVYAIKLLLESGYNVDEVHHADDSHHCRECRGTPLTYAIWLGFIEIVTVLLAAGADVTKMGAQSQTAIEMSRKCLSLPILRGRKDSTEGVDSKNRSVRLLIFDMACADLKAKHGMQYNQFIDTIYKRFPNGSCLRYAGIGVAHPDLARYELMKYRSATHDILPLLEMCSLCLLSQGHDGRISALCVGWIFARNLSVSLLRLFTDGLWKRSFASSRVMGKDCRSLQVFVHRKFSSWIREDILALQWRPL